MSKLGQWKWQPHSLHKVGLFTLLLVIPGGLLAWGTLGIFRWGRGRFRLSRQNEVGPMFQVDLAQNKTKNQSAQTEGGPIPILVPTPMGQEAIADHQPPPNSPPTQAAAA